MTKFKEKLVIIGAGGHAKVCYDIAKLMDQWNEIIILDDNSINDYFKITGPINTFSEYINDSEFFIAIGDNNIREKITTNLLDLKAKITTLIHPNAVIASDVRVGLGSVVMAGVVINSATRIGLGCIINTTVSIDHDNNISNYVHISPGACLSGSISIGELTWIGTGTTIINNINIGDSIIIGAGSLVIKNISEEGTYFGVPNKLV